MDSVQQEFLEQATHPRRPARRRGTTLWRGRSRITGAPIAAVLTFESDNEKTGPMLQTWMLRTDMDPLEASKTGQDDAICGNCGARGVADGDHAVGRWCYVILHFAPLGIWKNLMDGQYPAVPDRVLRSIVRGRGVRVGAYGDGVAVPKRIWTGLLRHADFHTAYTHGWHEPYARGYNDLFMASVESERDARIATALGWRYYRVKRRDDPVLAGEVVCPASAAEGYRLQCITCGACDGFRRAGQASIVTDEHGSPISRRNAVRHMDRLAILS